MLNSLLGTGFDLLLVVLGFSLIIIIHELGHFLAAKWAGIRTLAFAVGFGPAVCSYRRGLGFARGSTEPAYERLRRDAAEPEAGAPPERLERQRHAQESLKGVSSTEYRLNALPLGGYVKMLGQDDIDPTARSNEPDSYQNCPPVKRMVVISAGVVSNVVLAAVLFVLVFLIGLPTEPARVGFVEPGKPAASAVALNASELGVDEPGLMPADDVVTVNGREAASFNDITVAAAMTGPGETLDLVVRRPGVASPLRFAIQPEADRAFDRLLSIGIGPAVSDVLIDLEDPQLRERVRDRLSELVEEGELQPGWALASVEGVEGEADVYQFFERMSRAEGEAVRATFVDDAGAQHAVLLRPRPVLQEAVVTVADRQLIVPHLLGLAPLLSVDSVGDAKTPQAGYAKGLREGDIFARIGDLEWPLPQEGIAQIRANAGKRIELVMLRRDAASGEWRRVTLPDVQVERDGSIGFYQGSSERLAPFVGGVVSPESAAASLRLLAGSRLVTVDGEPVDDFGDAREALRNATREAFESGAPEATVRLSVALPTPTSPVEEVEWTLSRGELEELHGLGWASPIGPEMFELEEIVRQTSNPAEAIAMGVHETRRVMVMTYLTLVRLFQGTVRVEHLKGPVGIAHAGTLLADKGLVWLLFFMAIISVNLAVINFLPIPIVDGGHFLFLVWEQITGRPVSPTFQGIATLAGLVLIASVFLIVTFNDIVTLFGG